MIRITDVRVTPRNDERLKAFVTVTLNDEFVVRGLKIIEGSEGRLFVAMPSRKRPDGSYQDIAHPITPECRNTLEEAVMAEYNRLLRSGAPEENPSRTP